ncbi:MAG: Holliday junction resolvase RuvX [Acidobacteriota bacterium]
MAIDYGTRATGVAISDELRFTARPLTTLRAGGGQNQSVIERIAALVLEYEVGTVIVGLPLRLDGTRGDSAILVEKFSQSLQSLLTVPVLLRDERLTSRAADERLRDEGANSKRRRAD